MTLQTEILSTETSDFLKQFFFLKPFKSVLKYDIIFYSQEEYISVSHAKTVYMVLLLLQLSGELSMSRLVVVSGLFVG